MGTEENKAPTHLQKLIKVNHAISVGIHLRDHALQHSLPHRQTQPLHHAIEISSANDPVTILVDLLESIAKFGQLVAIENSASLQIRS